MECLAHHARLCTSGHTFRIEDTRHEGEPGKLITPDHQMPTAGLPFSMTEYSWTCVIGRSRQIVGNALRPILWLPQRIRAPVAEQIEVLGRVPELSDHEAMFIPNDQWELPNPRRDPMLQQLMLAHAKDVASRLPESDYLSMLQGEIVSAMHRGDPSIERVASRLGLTPRTLQRRLEAERTAFQEMLDHLRHELALRYLAGTRLSLTEIGNMLAYSDATAFGRAFRRWTGQTPTAFRAAQPPAEQPVAFAPGTTPLPPHQIAALSKV